MLQAQQKCRTRFIFGAKAELLGTLDAMLSAEWEATHPAEAAERRRFVEGVLAMSKKRSGRAFWVNPSLR